MRLLGNTMLALFLYFIMLQFYSFMFKRYAPTENALDATNTMFIAMILGAAWTAADQTKK